MSTLLPIIPNQVFNSAESGKSSQLGRFELCQDQQFGFYFNSEYQSVDYDSDKYQNEQAHSPIFVRHLKFVAQEIISRFGQSSSVVEVGCGKGYFFGLLSDLNFIDLRGFDKTYDGDDSRIAKRYITSSDTPLEADVLILRHVLEHVRQPYNFLKDLAKINGKSCSFVIEVPSTDWIVDNASFWDFTYEHVNYFTAASFCKMFDVCEVNKVFNDQYLLAFCNSDALKPRTNYQSEKSAVLKEMISNLEKNSLFDFALKQAGRYWIWGGATKGVLITYHLLRFASGSARPPEGIVDLNPAKQDKFSAGMGIKIFSPESLLSLLRDGDKIFVANPAYEVEIRKFLEENYLKKVAIEVLS